MRGGQQQTISYITLIGEHSPMQLIHPNQGHVTTTVERSIAGLMQAPELSIACSFKGSLLYWVSD